MCNRNNNRFGEIRRVVELISFGAFDNFKRCLFTGLFVLPVCVCVPAPSQHLVGVYDL